MKSRWRLGGMAAVIMVLWVNVVCAGGPVQVIGELEVADDHDSGIPGAIVFGDGSKQTTASFGTVISVGSGYGLLGGPITQTGTLSVNTDVIQNRVTGVCGLGSFFGAINSDGSVVCQSGANTGGTVTQVNSGAGLTGGPITTTGTLSVVFGGTGSATTVSRSDHTHNYDASYVNVTGDTMTGPLNLPANGLAVGTSQLAVSNGNVGIGTASPSQKLEVSGNVKISGAGRGLSFADGTVQTTAVSGGGGGVPSGFMILGETSTAPAGYAYAGKVLGMPGSWSEKADMQTDRYSAVAAVVNNKIYVIGGSDSPTVSTSLAINEEYDPVANTWSTKAPMPTARNGAVVGVANNKIYVIGGHTGSTGVTTNEEYDPATNTWSTKAPMSTAKWASAAGVVNGKIYVIGGVTAAAYSSLNQEYDPVSNAWTDKAPLPTLREWSSAVVVNDKIYVIGGNYGSPGAGVMAVNEEYDPATNTWTRKASMHTAREAFAAAVVNNRIYAISGVVTPTAMVGTNEEYVPATDSWTNKAGMPAPRILPAGAAVNGKVYVIGGTVWPALAPLSDNEEFTPDFLYVHKKN
jgi:N-acetylneuraminic acid mutarotase